MRTCSNCKKEFSETKFTISNNRKRQYKRYTNWCDNCYKEINKDWRRNHRVKLGLRKAFEAVPARAASRIVLEDSDLLALVLNKFPETYKRYLIEELNNIVRQISRNALNMGYRNATRKDRSSVERHFEAVRIALSELGLDNVIQMPEMPTLVEP